jgi:hypothetical protein
MNASRNFVNSISLVDYSANCAKIARGGFVKKYPTPCEGNEPEVCGNAAQLPEINDLGVNCSIEWSILY